MPSFRKYRRALRMRPINTQKHYTSFGPLQVTSGNVATITVVSAVETSDKNVNSEVHEGSHIKAIYWECWIRDENDPAGQADNFDIMLEKVASNQSNPSASEMANPNDYPNKKNIIFFTRGLAPGAGNSAVPILRGWIKIPKSKLRS